MDAAVAHILDRFRELAMVKINEVIKSGDAKALVELLHNPEDDTLLLMQVIDSAIKSGNLEMIETVLAFYRKQIFRDDINRWAFFEATLSLEVDPAKKWEIIDIILSYLFSEDPNRSDMFPPIMDIFYLILCCCLRQKELFDRFFNIYYTAEYNGFYLLMKRLEKAVDGSHYISILLHDDIDLSKIVGNLHIQCLFKMEFYITQHVKLIFETFVKLLQKNTKESMELAEESFKELLDKDFFEEYVLNTSYDFGELTVNMGDPLIQKLCFQFIYYLCEGPWQTETYKLITLWMKHCPFDSILYHQVHEFIRPFIQKPSPVEELLKKTQGDQDEENEMDQDVGDELEQDEAEESNPNKKFKLDTNDGLIKSLQELCRDVIRLKVAKNVDNMKTFFDQIWKFNVPETVKCNLLYISEASWMNDLIKF